MATLTLEKPAPERKGLTDLARMSPGGGFPAAVHPGEILEEEFLKPLNLTRYRLAKETGLSETQIGEIIRGERGVTAATALRLSRYFSNSARFWIDAQSLYDLTIEGERLRNELSQITPNAETAALAEEARRLR